MFFKFFFVLFKLRLFAFSASALEIFFSNVFITFYPYQIAPIILVQWHHTSKVLIRLSLSFAASV